MDSIVSLKVKTTKGSKVGVRSLVYNTSRVEGCAGALEWGLGQMISGSIIHTDQHKLNNKLISA